MRLYRTLQDIKVAEGVSAVAREKFVETVCPDISLFDQNGSPVRFIEVVDSHAPEKNVHEYALLHGIEVLEIHLRADRAFTGRRRNRALDASLTVKARLQELSDGRLIIDAHNRLCQRPKCQQCGSPLPLRKVMVSVKDCWKCGQNVNVATVDKDGGGLEQDYFTTEEIEFAREHGVTLERRFSATLRGKYLTNVCTSCNQIQGNWFLYMDPLHDRFNLRTVEREAHGPCDRCAERYCLTHGEYMDYRGEEQCPTCLEEAERVMCPNNPDRECFYPDRCEEGGCYFLNREQQRKAQLEQAERQQRIDQERQERHRKEGHERLEQQKQQWAEFQNRFDERQKPEDEKVPPEDKAA